ncbi:MAG: tetratricopeptide repeat protein [Beijerinckiaceae bacterium]|nr:tetratricopeptide repeat protein [Beijerinckiaceae bacterium]
MPCRPSVPDAARFRRAGASRWASELARVSVIVAVSFMLGGCLGRGADDVTGSVRTAQPDQLRAQSSELGERYAKKPGEKAVSLRYAQVLRALGQHAQAVAVLEAASIANQKDTEVQAAYGKALIEAGRLDQAATVLASVNTPDRPDWRILSAQGTIADQQSRHEDAQRFYHDALKIAPNEPTILSNLGLSYALSKRLDLAEQTLRQAAGAPKTDPRVRGNLALVLALQGKFKESEEVASRDLSLADAEANVSYVRQMITQKNSWKQIEKAEKGIGKNRAPIGGPHASPSAG